MSHVVTLADARRAGSLAELRERAASPVLAESTGRRWRRTKALATAAAALAVVCALLGTALLYQPVEESGAGVRTIDLALVGSAPPVVGAGPLVRVVRVEAAGSSARLVDPRTGTLLAVLSQDDRERVGAAPYAVQRYGYAVGTPRTMSLTFEGGPDERYTPLLLELLEREDVPATFFVTGARAARHPGIVAAASSAGHLVGHNSVTHGNLAAAPHLRRQIELVGGDRILRSLTERESNVVRVPFLTMADASAQLQVPVIVDAQNLGYVVAGYDADVFDLDVPAPGVASDADLVLPVLDGSSITVRLHDGGGSGRARTVAFTEDLIEHARAHGYTFTTLEDSQQGVSVGPVAPTGTDTLARAVAEGLLVWPDRLLLGLFGFALIAMLGLSGATIVLALRRGRRHVSPRSATSSRRNPPLTVSVVLAAYNEQDVIDRTLRALGGSERALLEILVVDDGSTDRTPEIVLAAARHDPRIRLLRQPNTGKSGALNHGLARTAADVVVTIDADTLVTPTTVGNLARRFDEDDAGDLGVVAGVVRVGNRARNVLTRWQALEYLTQISVERAAQDQLGAIMIVPGACAAWRRRAVIAVGGYAGDNLAEDCDLTLTLHRAGWRITQDDDAIAYTEVPEDVDSLLKQRVRWTFGTVQVLVKRRDMIGGRKHGWLSAAVLPWAAATILIPMLSMPFMALMALVALRGAGWTLLVAYGAVFLLAQLAVAATGVRLAKERWHHLLMVPVYRVVFEPLRCYLIYASLISVLRGSSPGWNKLARTGTVTVPQDAIAVAR